MFPRWCVRSFFIGDQNTHHGGIVLVAQLGVCIGVIQIFRLKLDHQRLKIFVVVTKALELAPVPLDFVNAQTDGVRRHDDAAHMHVDPDVDPFVFQTLDPPVEGVQSLGVQVARVLERRVEDIWERPRPIVMVNSHQVVAELGHAVSLLTNILPWGAHDGGRHEVSRQKRTGVPS